MYCVICENIILTEKEALELENKKKQEKKQPKKPVTEKPVELAQKTTSKTTSETPNSKRQKTTVHQAGSNDVITTLSQKMDELAKRVEDCHDPKELCSLFKAIKQCASAIQACAEANKAMH